MQESRICKFPSCPKRPIGPALTAIGELRRVYSKVNTWVKCQPCDGTKYDTPSVIDSNPSSSKLGL